MKAPLFSAEDYRGETISLSDYSGKNVVLVFNRGFV
jgi:peroxiredoxin